MKIAVISDIHGNLRALEKTLEDIAKLRVDQIICAGDTANPFLRSLDTWRLLKSLNIPIIRGNHEDYIVSYFTGDRPEIQDAVQFRPIQAVARHIGPEIAREFATLPFELLVPGPGGDDLYICHASPQHNARSYIKGVDAKMATHFERVKARTVVAGHIHTQWAGQWQNKRLIIGGSVGLPHHGKPEAEYVIMTHARGAWQWDLRTVPYDSESAMREYIQSGALEQGGPIAWMLYDELWCAEPRLPFFLPRALGGSTPAKSLAEWERAAQDYLTSIGRWDALKRVCKTSG